MPLYVRENMLCFPGLPDLYRKQAHLPHICKHLVGRCELEKQLLTPDESGKSYAPKVAPLSSPLAQLDKVWEAVNNFTIRNKRNDLLYISLEQRKALVEYLQNNLTIKKDVVRDILEIGKSKE